MGKQLGYTTDKELSSDSNHLGDEEFYSFEDEELYDELEDESEDDYRAHRRKPKKKSRDARRLIEQYWEERSLRDQLDEYYMHPDD